MWAQFQVFNLNPLCTVRGTLYNVYVLVHTTRIVVARAMVYFRTFGTRFYRTQQPLLFTTLGWTYRTAKGESSVNQGSIAALTRRVSPPTSRCTLLSAVTVSVVDAADAASLARRVGTPTRTSPLLRSLE